MVGRTDAGPRRGTMRVMPAEPVVPAPPRRHVFRPHSAMAAAICWGAVTLGWVWFALHDGGLLALVRQGPSIVLAATLVYGVLVRPSVEVSPAGVSLRNVVRDVEVPWAALAEVRTRFALTLETTDGRRFTAWAAPASGRHTDTRLTVREVRTLGLGSDPDLPTASSSTASQSGAVAAWVRREWGRAIEVGEGRPFGSDAGRSPAPFTAAERDSAATVPGRVDAAPVRTRTAWGVLVVAGVSAALVVVTALA